jgi:hypothetical protein
MMGFLNREGLVGILFALSRDENSKSKFLTSMDRSIDAILSQDFQKKSFFQSHFQSIQKNHEYGGCQSDRNPARSQSVLTASHPSNEFRVDANSFQFISQKILSKSPQSWPNLPIGFNPPVPPQPLLSPESIFVQTSSVSPLSPLFNSSPLNPLESQICQGLEARGDAQKEKSVLVRSSSPSLPTQDPTSLQDPIVESLQLEFQKQIQKLYPQVIIPVLHPHHGCVTIFLQFQHDGWTRARFETPSEDLQVLLARNRHLFETILNESPLKSRPIDLSFIHRSFGD